MEAVLPDDHFPVTKHGDVIVVRVSHRRLVGEVVAGLAERLASLANQPQCTKLLLNLSGVEWLSTEMFARLIALKRTIRKNGGSLRLCEVNPYIREVFSQTRLDQIFDMDETEESGLKAWAGERS